jgi:demethylspheroidene O-methyltransferase
MRDRLLAMRDRLLTNVAAQRMFAAFPLTRPIANAQARKAFDICAGFVYSQVALACVRLGILDAVRASPLAVDDLARLMDLPLTRARTLIDAAVAIDLLSHRSRDRVGLGQIGAAIAGNPSISAMIEHHALLYDDLSDPVSVLRGSSTPTNIRQFWSYASGGARAADSDHETAAYSKLMGQSQSLISADIIAAHSFAPYRRILDIGGGHGAFLAALARSFPHFEGRVFDLPAVAAQANRHFAESGLAERCMGIGGDFLADPLPTNFDAATLVRILHDHDDDVALRLLQAARRAIRPGGTLIIAEPMRDTPRAAPISDAYFGFYLLAMGSGRTRTPEEISHMLGASGFSAIRVLRTRQPLLIRVITAQTAQA